MEPHLASSQPMKMNIRPSSDVCLPSGSRIEGANYSTNNMDISAHTVRDVIYHPRAFFFMDRAIHWGSDSRRQRCTAKAINL
jgi:hypothetical protein